MRNRPPALLRFLVAALCAATLLTVPIDGDAASSGKKRVQADAGSWVKRFKPVYLDTAWSAVNTRDGNVVVGIQTLGARGSPNEMVLAKLDLRGKQLWRARVAGSDDGTGSQPCEIPMALREAADGALLLAGNRCRQAWPYAWFARLDPEAKLLWETAPDKDVPLVPGKMPAQSYGWDVVEWPDGSVLGLGLHTGSSGYSVWLLDIAADGRVNKQRADYNALFDEYGWGVSAGVAGGQRARIAFTVGENRGDTRIGQLDRDLTFHEETRHSTPDSDEARALRATPDGGYCLLLARDYARFLERRDAAGALLWQHPLVDHGSRLLASRDSGCLVGAGPESGATSLRLRKYTKDGEVAWSQEIAGRWTPRAFLETPAGGLIITGTEVPANYRGAVAYVMHIAAADLGRVNLKPLGR
jgi:hypothetical protein